MRIPTGRTRDRQAGGGASGIRWDRLGRMALLVLVALVVASYGDPALKYFGKRGQIDQQKAELRALEAKTRRLERNVHELTDPRLLELHARRLGMIKEGERAYSLEPSRPPAE